MSSFKGKVALEKVWNCFLLLFIGIFNEECTILSILTCSEWILFQEKLQIENLVTTGLISAIPVGPWNCLLLRHYDKKGEKEVKGKKKKEELTQKEYYLKDQFKTTEEALGLFKDDELMSKPGEEFVFQN